MSLEDMVKKVEETQAEYEDWIGILERAVKDWDDARRWHLRSVIVNVILAVLLLAAILEVLG